MRLGENVTWGTKSGLHLHERCRKKSPKEEARVPKEKEKFRDLDLLWFGRLEIEEMVE